MPTSSFLLLAGRAKAVQKQFETALGQDDFIQRVEMALFAYGFTGDNSIGALRLACRLRAALV